MNGKGKGRRRGQRLAAAAGSLLAAGLAGALPGGVHAADTGAVDVSVASGWGGTVDGDSWVPVTVTLHNRGADFRGQVILTLQGAAGNGSRCFSSNGGFTCQSFGSYQNGSFADYTVPVALAAGVTKSVTVTVLAGTSSLHVRLRGDDGKELAAYEGNLDVSFGGSRTVVAVVSAETGTLDSLGAARGVGGAPVVLVHLRPADLPAQRTPLTTFDTVVLDRAPTDTLASPQRQALVDYVEGGGSLVVVGGSDVRATLAGLPGELVPVTVRGSTSLAGMPVLAALAGAAPLAAAIPTTAVDAHGSVLLREAGRPVITVARRGLGQVAFVAVDPGAEPLASWSADHALLRRLLSRSAATAGPTMPAARFKGGPAASDGRVELATEMGTISQAAAQIPGIALPEPATLGLLLLGYILLAGPVSYLLLSRLHRRDLLWASVPALAVATALVAYATGLGTSGHGLVVDEVRVVHLLPGSDRATVDAFTDVFSTHGGTYELRLAGSPSVTSLPDNVDTNRLTVLPENNPVLAEVNVAAASLGGFATSRSTRVSGSVSADLHDDGRITTGTVTNHLGVDLTDGWLVSPNGQTTPIGDLGNGDSTQVHVDHSGNGFVNPGGGYSQPLLGASGAAQREAQRRQIASALQEAAAQASHGHAMLVAIASHPLLPADISADNVDPTLVDSVVVPLVSDVGVAGTVSGMNATLVDFQSGGALAGGTGGSAVYQASLQPGTTWKDISVNLQSGCFNGGCFPVIKGPPPVPVPMPVPAPAPIGGSSGSAAVGGFAFGATPSRIPAQTSVPLLVDAFDPRSDTWVQVQSVMPGTQQFALPTPQRFVDGDGNLRLRVVGPNGSSYDATVVQVSADPVSAQP